MTEKRRRRTPIIEKRQKEVKNRRGYLLTLIITLILWFLTIMLILLVSPATKFALEAFYISSFLTLLFTFSVLFTNTRRGLIMALTIVSFLLLSSLGIGSLFNGVLLLVIAGIVEYYFSSNY